MGHGGPGQYQRKTNQAGGRNRGQRPQEAPSIHQVSPFRSRTTLPRHEWRMGRRRRYSPAFQPSPACIVSVSQTPVNPCGGAPRPAPGTTVPASRLRRPVPRFAPSAPGRVYIPKIQLRLHSRAHSAHAARPPASNRQPDPKLTNVSFSTTSVLADSHIPYSVSDYLPLCQP